MKVSWKCHGSAVEVQWKCHWNAIEVPLKCKQITARARKANTGNPSYPWAILSKKRFKDLWTLNENLATWNLLSIEGALQFTEPLKRLCTVIIYCCAVLHLVTIRIQIIIYNLLVINRLGVSGAVLWTASWLTNWFSQPFPPVTCHVSRVTFFLWQSFEAYWWRVCCQQGLSRLVYENFLCLL